MRLACGRGTAIIFFQNIETRTMAKARVCNNLTVAISSAAALASLIASGGTCSFLTVRTRSGQPLTFESSRSGQYFPAPVSYTSIGVLCDGDLYDLSGDRIWRLCQALFYIAVVSGSLVTAIAWATCTFFPSSTCTWRLITFSASICSIATIPIFVLFEIKPCTAYEGQSCTLSVGSYLLIVSSLLWIIVTLIAMLLGFPSRSEDCSLPKTETAESNIDNQDQEMSSSNFSIFLLISRLWSNLRQRPNLPKTNQIDDQVDETYSVDGDEKDIFRETESGEPIDYELEHEDNFKRNRKSSPVLSKQPMSNFSSTSRSNNVSMSVHTLQPKMSEPPNKNIQNLPKENIKIIAVTEPIHVNAQSYLESPPTVNYEVDREVENVSNDTVTKDCGDWATSQEQGVAAELFMSQNNLESLSTENSEEEGGVEKVSNDTTPKDCGDWAMLQEQGVAAKMFTSQNNLESPPTENYKEDEEIGNTPNDTATKDCGDWATLQGKGVAAKLFTSKKGFARHRQKRAKGYALMDDDGSFYEDDDNDTGILRSPPLETISITNIEAEGIHAPSLDDDCELLNGWESLKSAPPPSDSSSYSDKQDIKHEQELLDNWRKLHKIFPEGECQSFDEQSSGEQLQDQEMPSFHGKDVYGDIFRSGEANDSSPQDGILYTPRRQSRSIHSIASSAPSLLDLTIEEETADDLIESPINSSACKLESAVSLHIKKTASAPENTTLESSHLILDSENFYSDSENNHRGLQRHQFVDGVIQNRRRSRSAPRSFKQLILQSFSSGEASDSDSVRVGVGSNLMWTKRTERAGIHAVDALSRDSSEDSGSSVSTNARMARIQRLINASRVAPVFSSEGSRSSTSSDARRARISRDARKARIQRLTQGSRVTPVYGHTSESFLLDTLDMKRALAQRPDGEEYGLEEDSI